MNAILGTISSGVPVVPTEGSASQPSGQGTRFASALAAAQGVANSPQGLGRGTGGAVTGAANPVSVAAANGAASSTVAPSPAKKLPNNAPAGAANLVPIVNPVVPAVPLPSPSEIASLAPSIIPGVALEAASGSSRQTGITASANATDQRTLGADGSSISRSAFRDSPPAAITAASSYLANQQAIALQSAATEQGPTPTTQGEIAEVEIATSVDTFPEASEGTVSAADTSIPITSPPASESVPESDAQPLPNGASSGAPSITQLDRAAGNSGPVLLASANSAPANSAGESPQSSWGSANLQGTTALPSAPASPGVATPWSPAQAAINSSIPLAPLPVSTGLLPASPAANGKPATPFAAARANAAAMNPTGNAAAQGSGTAASRAPVASPSSSSEAPGSSGSNDPGQQTPFTVFFSNSGPGTESAAAALPKMMLPPTGSAIPGNQAAAITAAGAKSNNALGTGLQPATNAKSATTAEGTPLPPTSIQQTAAVTAANAQSNPAQTVGVQAPPASLSAANALPLAPSGSPENALPPKAALPTTSPNAGASASPMAEPPAIPATGPVQMAQLVSQAGQSAMRIGMNTSAFGSVEVRTVVHASDVGLVIGSEKGDLRTLLGNEMPAITSSLQQQNLRLNSVSYMQGFAFSNDFSGGGGSQQRSFMPNPAPSYGSGPAEDPVESPPMAAFVGGANSLSILA